MDGSDAGNLVGIEVEGGQQDPVTLISRLLNQVIYPIRPNKAREDRLGEWTSELFLLFYHPLPRLEEWRVILPRIHHPM
jgi:hypothetical protein